MSGLNTQDREPTVQLVDQAKGVYVVRTPTADGSMIGFRLSQDHAENLLLELAQRVTFTDDVLLNKGEVL